tara:strand:- start:1032 stop:1196 length:165 start_codon:yes stop_codon:yes gene_type:complete
MVGIAPLNPPYARWWVFMVRSYLISLHPEIGGKDIRDDVLGKKERNPQGGSFQK